MASENSLGNLRIWFGAAVVVGTAGILGGWLLGGMALLSSVLTVGVPLGAMAGYLTAAVVTDRTNLVTLQFADSVYYLGFLFTLISLSVSLLAFTNTAGGYDLPGVVSRFGVALLTTVVGLACRIYLVNFRKSMDDTLAQSETALADAGESLRHRLEQLSQDMTVQTKLMNDSLRGALDVTAAELKAAAETGKSTVETSAKALETALGSVATQVAESARGGSTAISESMEGLAKQLASTTLPSDIFTTVLSPAVDALAQQVRQYGGVLESAGESHQQVAAAATSLAAGVDALRQSGDQFSTTIGALNDGTNRLAGFGNGLEQIADAIAKVTSGLGEYQKLVGRMREEGGRDVEALAGYRSQMRGNLEESQRSLERVREDLVSAAGFIRRELGGGSTDR